MFEDEKVEIRDTNFMNRLKQVVTQKQFQQTTNDIVKTSNNSKEDFCKRNYYSLQDAKARLNALITEIMMCEAGYIIDQAMQEYKTQTTELNQVKTQLDKYTDVANTARSNRDKLIKEIEMAKKTLIETLQEELISQTDTNGEEGQNQTRANTSKCLKNFLKEDEFPTPKSGSRTDQKEQAIYTNELQTLTK